MIVYLDNNPGDNECQDVAVYGELLPDGELRPGSLALLAAARDLVHGSGPRTALLLIGDGLVETARRFYANGADRVFVYDDPSLKEYDAERYAAVVNHFVTNYKPSAILFDDTPQAQPLLAPLGTVEAFDGWEDPVNDPDRKGELIICEMPGEIVSSQ